MPVNNQYIIIRHDLAVDPVTIISEGLLIGRLTKCELMLNHPSVSRVQAGIKQFENAYYLFSLRPRNPVLLNGKPVEDNEALAAGDVLEVGPFQVEIETAENALVLRVELRIGMRISEIDVSDPGLSTDNLVEPAGAKAKKRPAPVAGTKALDIFWDRRIREAGKIARPSPLFPKGGRRSGKAQFNWSPTTDLVSRWPAAFFTWAVIVVGGVSIGAAYWYTNAFAPGPLSKAHAATQLSMTPAIAVSPNSGSCTTCHALKGSMNERCAGCHETDAFKATMIKPHVAAGIGCADCHSEHEEDAQFDSGDAALASCTSCHNDSNRNVYNGRKIGTPHGGTFGYPVVNGQWSAKSINDEEWDLRKLTVVRLPTDSDQKWRSNQFHALHDQRVKVVAGIVGNKEGRLSCSSCHQTFDPAPDRVTPRTTCAACHSTATGQPDCTSCHVQHIHDTRRWSTSFLATLPHAR